MTPVDQPDARGCFSACVASLLELPIAEVPFFMTGDGWWDGFLGWLWPRGLYAICVPLVDDWRPPGLHILSGQSPRGPHSVVARGDELVHDPNPARSGLLTYDDVIILVPLDPAQGGARP